MNPAAFPAPAAPGDEQLSLPMVYTHTKRVARSSLGETTSPRPRNLVVNLPIDGD